MRFSHHSWGHESERRHLALRGLERGNRRRSFESEEEGREVRADRRSWDRGPHEHRGHRGHGRHGLGHGEGHGGRRRRVFDSGELRLVLLKLIADQPRHGYELIRAIEELTGGSYVPSPGVVYPTLTMLQDMGQIEEATSEGARKAFAITAQGTAELATKEAEVRALFARLAELATARERTDGGPIRRAMANLDRKSVV